MNAAGLSPNRLTILGLVFILIASYFLYYEEILFGVFFMAIGSIADVLDGLVARSTDQTSNRGGFLDSLVDRYSDTFLIGALLLGGWIGTLSFLDWKWDPISEIPGEAWALGALSGALLTSYARANAERYGVNQQGVGLIERPERMFILFMGLILDQVTATLALLTVLGHLTVIQRGIHFWKHCKAIRNNNK